MLEAVAMTITPTATLTLVIWRQFVNKSCESIQERHIQSHWISFELIKLIVNHRSDSIIFVAIGNDCYMMFDVDNSNDEELTTTMMVMMTLTVMKIGALLHCASDCAIIELIGLIDWVHKSDGLSFFIFYSKSIKNPKYNKLLKLILKLMQGLSKRDEELARFS